MISRDIAALRPHIATRGALRMGVAADAALCAGRKHPVDSLDSRSHASRLRIYKSVTKNLILTVADLLTKVPHGDIIYTAVSTRQARVLTARPAQRVGESMWCDAERRDKDGNGGVPMNIDERKFQILKALIDDYIMTAAPVGSRTISRKSGVGYSAATIRNEMSDLEELGYLAHIHTSSGRIPSHKAYRLYVDKLMKVVPLSSDEAASIRSHFSSRAGQVEEVVRQAAQVLSDVTRYTSIVTAPQAAQLKIKRLQVVPVSPGQGLMVIVTDSGIVRDAMINYSPALEPDHLYMISKMLSEKLENLPLEQLKPALGELQARLHDHEGLFDALIGAADVASEDTSPEDMVIGGPTNMLEYPEYSDVDKARTVLKVLENRDMLANMLRGSAHMEFTVRIGPENNVPEMQDCSLVTATYRIGDNNVGTIGIIGPTRMNYGKVIAVLDYMGKSLGDILSGR